MSAGLWSAPVGEPGNGTGSEAAVLGLTDPQLLVSNPGSRATLRACPRSGAVGIALR